MLCAFALIGNLSRPLLPASKAERKSILTLQEFVEDNMLFICLFLFSLRHKKATSTYYALAAKSGGPSGTRTPDQPVMSRLL